MVFLALVSGFNDRCLLQSVLNAIQTANSMILESVYTTPVVVVDEGLQKKVESLQDEIGSLKTEKSDLLDLRDNLLEIQDDLLKLLHNLKEKPSCTENTSYVQMRNKPPQFFNAKEAQGSQSGYSFGSYSSKQQLLHCNFKLQHELAIEGGRLLCHGLLLSKSDSQSKNICDGWDAYAQQD
ncbi:hypothetical protein OIU85_023440 [Salix viminalis]|uniref:Uncharacterized protein n=1 Tax=Salix viminalis TaxID=40686 RepID=A0A9Q0TYQ8_SALVM|nr:hypothetical protein OIU85_023440 [Salix viminalis]